MSCLWQMTVLDLDTLLVFLTIIRCRLASVTHLYIWAHNGNCDHGPYLYAACVCIAGITAGDEVCSKPVQHQRILAC